MLYSKSEFSPISITKKGMLMLEHRSSNQKIFLAKKEASVFFAKNKAKILIEENTWLNEDAVKISIFVGVLVNPVSLEKVRTELPEEAIYSE